MTWTEAILGPIVEFLTIVIIIVSGAAISFAVITVITTYKRRKRIKKLKEVYKNNWPRKKDN